MKAQGLNHFDSWQRFRAGSDTWVRVQALVFGHTPPPHSHGSGRATVLHAGLLGPL